MDPSRVDYLPRSDRGKAMLRLTIPRGEEIALVVISFAALQVVAIGLKSDDEASMRAAFIGYAFALNAKLSSRRRAQPAFPAASGHFFVMALALFIRPLLPSLSTRHALRANASEALKALIQVMRTSTKGSQPMMGLTREA